MNQAEYVRIVTFVSVVFIVFFKAGLFVARRLFAPPGGAAVGPMRTYERGVIGLAVVGAACVLYGWAIEPYWLMVRHVTISLPGKIAPASGPVRIVHFSDLHCDPKVRLEDDLARVAAAEKPDLITFTGDAVNGPDGLVHFRRTMTALAAVAPVYAVLGNWDVYFFPDLDYYGQLPVHHLRETGELLSVRGTKLWIVGMSAGSERALPALMRAKPPGAVSVVLHHYPDSVEDAAALGADLYLCGHTHGGQVALPFYGALVTFSKFGKTYERGLYHVGSTWAYTNPGVGMEGGRAPRVRFCARPELTVLDLTP